MKNLSIEHRQAISKGLKGKTKSEQHIKNMVKAITGRKLSHHHRSKISVTLKGRKKPRRISFEDRFWARVDKTGECWVWKGSLFHNSPYGQVKQEVKTKQVHRVSWEIHYGPIPNGLCVCHKCDNPPCVRPDHLFTGTNFENTMDSVRKGRCEFVKNNPMRNPESLEKVIGKKRGVPRPYMKRGSDGKYIGRVIEVA